MLFGEITYVYSEDHSKSTDALCQRKKGLRLSCVVCDWLRSQEGASADDCSGSLCEGAWMFC
jgi:hypothetical protein